MTCFANGVFLRNDNGLFEINWDELPVCDDRALEPECEPEQSLHYDAAQDKFWADPTACHTRIAAEVDTFTSHTTTEPTIDQNGGVFSEYLTQDFDLVNPSNCLDSYAVVLSLIHI